VCSCSPLTIRFFKTHYVPDSFNHSFGSLQADGTRALTPGALSLMTSMINVGELVGSLASAPINDYLGRKGGWLIGATGVCLGAILQIVTTGNPNMISGGRCLLGFGVGVFCATSPIYIAVGSALSNGCRRL
jgi:MFS transporter, SP family, sugar:H+ symporter